MTNEPLLVFNSQGGGFPKAAVLGVHVPAGDTATEMDFAPTPGVVGTTRLISQRQIPPPNHSRVFHS